MSDIITSLTRAAGTVTINARQASRIGYGLGSLARSADTTEGFDAGVKLLRHALDGGVEFYDTAEFYDSGRSNQLLAEAFAAHRDEVVLASKVGARPITGPVPMTAAQRPSELREAVEQLRTLRTDHLDLVYLRRMDMQPGLVIPDDSDQKVNLDDQLAEMVRLRAEGLIGAIGLSHITLDQLRQALPAGIAAVSNIHNMVQRDSEPLLDVCQDHTIVWSPYFPLGGGGWAGLRKVVDEPLVQAAATQLDATPNQIGPARLLARSPLSLVIAGTSTTHHLDENIYAASITLPDDLLADLNAIT